MGTNKKKMDNSPWLLRAIIIGSILFGPADGDESGPVIIEEPENRVDFSNSTGASLHCVVKGRPSPSIIWTRAEDDTAVGDIPGLRRVLLNGTLMFPPFRAEDYKQEVHAQVYRCVASNIHGSVLSKDVHIRAVVAQPYETRVADEFVIKGNSAIIKCSIPSLVADFVSVTSWITDMGETFVKNSFCDGKYLVLPSGELYIKSVTLEDGENSYSCRTIHRITQETRLSVTAGRLVISAPLSVQVEPKVQTAEVGRPSTFSCTYSGNPVTSVEWFKDGEPLKIKETILRIQNVRREDKGMYQCFVRNDHESAQGIGELKFGERFDPPQLTYKFVEETLQPGASVLLKCVATGNPTPEISWELDRTPLTNSERVQVGQYVAANGKVVSHVNITTIQTNDGGLYSCIASSSQGSTRHSARRNVYGFPYIRPMDKVTVVAGKNMIVHCPVTGYPIDFIFWEMNGRMIPFHRRQKTYPNGTLIVEGIIRSADQGRYTCVARNAQSYTARGYLDVQVMEAPQILLKGFGSTTFYEGDFTQANCVVTKGDQPVTLSWLLNGKNLVNSKDLNIHNMDRISILVLNPVKSHHRGNYSCVATNSVGTVEKLANLSVNVPLPWIVEPVDIAFFLGSDAYLECKADGRPKPSFLWKKATDHVSGYYRELALDNPNIRVTDNGTLNITNIQKSHEGFYLCEANNGIMGLSAVTYVRVLAPPKFQIQYRNQTARRSDDVVLGCEAEGETPIGILWSRDEDNIEPNVEERYTIYEEMNGKVVHSSLSIKKTDRSDSAIYTCVATNAFGSADTTINLIIQEKPDQPDSLKVLDKSGRSVELSWTPPYNGNSPIKRYMVQYKPSRHNWELDGEIMMVRGNQHVATVLDLRPATTYQLRIVARNEIGDSDPSDTVTIITTEETPSSPPLDLKVKAVDKNSLRVTWQPPLKEEWNGDIQGFQVRYRLASSNNSYVYETVDFSKESGKEHHLLISTLEIYTEYAVVVSAFNKVGQGPKSNEVKAHTAEGTPQKPPQEVACTTLTSQIIRVLWVPPPLSSVQGVIKGYKVMYGPSDHWYDDKTKDTKITGSTETHLHGLQKYTNYSLTVLAFTSGGEGVLSSVIHCRTDNDIPEAPTSVKALVMSAESILVSWLSPEKPNGIITQYTTYYKKHGTADSEAMSYKVPPSQLNFKVTELKKQDDYVFWVTASTSFGEGEHSQQVYMKPSDQVPAKIASFDDEYLATYKEDVKLQCQAVGIPAPQIRWTIQGEPYVPNDRMQLLPEGSLLIREALQDDAGEYTCHVENSYGQDTVTHVLLIQASPHPPEINILSTTTNSIEIKLKPSVVDDTTHIHGYTISYKPEFSDLETFQVVADARTYILENLRCASGYQIFARAYNKIGSGEPSETLNTRTKGKKPISPDVRKFVEVSSSSITLHLTAWIDGGCPINYFVVEYKQKHKHELVMASNQVKPTGKYVIMDLTPAMRYNLRISAYNDAGFSVAEYECSTLTLTGAVSI